MKIHTEVQVMTLSGKLRVRIQVQHEDGRWDDPVESHFPAECLAQLQADTNNRLVIETEMSEELTTHDGSDTIEDVRSDLRHARERIDGLAASRSELLGQVAKLTDEREELAGLHRQLHDERSKIGPWDLEAIGAIRARIERLDPSSTSEPRPAFEPTEHWKQRNDPDHTHCSDCGDLIDSASRGCESAGDGAGCRGFE